MPKKNSKNLAQELSRYSSHLKYSHISKKAIHQAKVRLIDSLGCALSAIRAKPATIVKKTIDKTSLDKSGATLIGTAQKVFPPLAAFYNGTLIRYWDYNDTYLSKEPAHPSDNIAALLSVAEISKASGKDLITAIVLSYEIQCGLCDAQSLRTKGWDHVSYGNFSASLGAGKLMKLSTAQLQHALSLSAVANMALRQTRVGEISYWKASAFAHVSSQAVFSCLLAQSGFTGPNPIVEGEKGVEKIVSGPLNVKLKNRDYKILNTYIKNYPVEYHSQAAVEAALILKSEINKKEKIKRIEIKTYDVALEIIVKDPQKWKPKERETADHSLPFVVARSLLDGKMTLKQYSDKKIKDLQVLKLMKKIKISEDKKMTRDYPNKLTCQIKIWLEGNKKPIQHSVSYPKGHFKNPMSDIEVENKFRELTKFVLPTRKQNKVLDLLWNIEKIKNFDQLFNLLRIG